MYVFHESSVKSLIHYYTYEFLMNATLAQLPDPNDYLVDDMKQQGDYREAFRDELLMYKRMQLDQWKAMFADEVTNALRHLIQQLHKDLNALDFHHSWSVRVLMPDGWIDVSHHQIQRIKPMGEYIFWDRISCFRSFEDLNWMLPELIKMHAASHAFMHPKMEEMQRDRLKRKGVFAYQQLFDQLLRTGTHWSTWIDSGNVGWI